MRSRPGNATAPDQPEPAYVGFDVVVAADDQIRQIYGFIDRTLVTAGEA
ncbi:MAG: hypothetical protein WCB57_08545 [Pseudonocardiaceae bacterium]